MTAHRGTDEGPGKESYENRVFDQAMLDSINDVLFTFTGEGDIVRWNRRVNEVTGYSDQEIASMHPLDFVPEREKTLVAEKIEEALRQGEAVVEAHYVTKDGRQIPYEFTGSLLRQEGRELICGAGRDISKRREQEQRLKESERRYRQLFENSQEAIAVTTPDGEVIDVNGAACGLIGYSRDELIQLNVAELYASPEERREVVEQLEKQGAVRNRLVRMHRKDGDEVIVQLSASVLRDMEGEVRALQGFFRDMTEEVRMQEQLRESEQKYRRLFEESRDAVILTTPAGDILDVNTSAKELFGYREEEFLAMDAGNLYAWPQERRERILPELLEARSSSVLEAEMRHKDGSIFLASASVTAHRDEEGNPELIQALVRDITRQRRLKEQLLEIQEEERRRIGQELHDGIASQLTGIAMLGEAILQNIKEGEVSTTDEFEEVIQLIHETDQQTRRLSRGLNPVQVGREGLPAALEKLARNTERQSSLSCSFERPENLPEFDQEKATHLYRIAQEAVTNAVKHAEASRIDIYLSSSDEQVELSIVDDGKGMPEELETSDGIGLHTMRYRADIIGATLRLTNEKDGGLRVRCSLPR